MFPKQICNHVLTSHKTTGWGESVQNGSSLEMMVSATTREQHIYCATCCPVAQQEEPPAGEQQSDELPGKATSTHSLQTERYVNWDYLLYKHIIILLT